MQHPYLPKYRFLLLSGLLFFAVNLFAQIPTENLQLWLRADSVEIIDGKVSRWYDLSSNNNIIQQTEVANRPIKVDDGLGGKPVVTFDGVNDYLDGGDILDLETNSHTFFIIAKNTNSSLSYFIAKGILQSVAGRWGIRPESYHYQDNSPRNMSFTFPTDTYALITALNDRTSATNSLHLNTNLAGSTAINATHNFNSSYNFLIGAYNNSSGNTPPASYLKGVIAEIIIYNQNLTENERQYVEIYLMNKYAPPITLGNDSIIEYGFKPIELIVNSTHTNLLWSTGSTTSTTQILESGRYWIQGTDIFDRITSDTVEMSFPVPTLTYENSTLCPDKTYRFHTGDFNSTTNYTIEWFNGFVGDTLLLSNYEGEVWAKVIDNENYYAYSDTIEVTLDNFKNQFLLGNDTTFCSGNSISLLENPWFPQITEQQWSTGSTETSIPVYTSDNYSVVVQNSNGCSAEDTMYVNIEGIAPTVDFDISGICKATDVILTNQSSANASDPIVGQKWYFGNGDSSEMHNPTYVYPNAGEYQITLEVYAESGCNNSLIKEHTIREIPTAFFETDTACSNNAYFFFDQSTPLEETTLEHWNWNFGDSQESMEQNPSHIFSDILQYSVSLTVTDNYGCSNMHDTLLTVVDIMNQPQPFTLIAPANNFLSNNTSISFSWNSSQYAHFYQLEVSLDETFETLVLDSTLFETSLTISLNAEQYFWRVTAKNYCNNSFASTTRRFTTGILQLQPGLMASYSASDGLSTDMENRVSSWSDGTENGFDATQTEDNQKPLLVDNVLNNKPAVQFAHNNAANYLDINQIELTEDNYTIIAVMKPELFDLPVHYLLSGGTPTTSDGGVFAGGTLVQGVGLFDGNNTLRGNNNSTDWQLIVIQNDTIFINGYEIDYGAYSLLSDLKINLLGSRTNALNTQYFNGYLTDLLIYNTKLSKTERSEAENYLRYKYFPPINLGSDQLLSCGSCNVLLEAPDYYNQYLWSTGETTSQITVSQTGNYWVSVTDIFGFTSIDTLFIQCPSVSCYPEVDLGDDIIVPCGTCDVTLSAHADHFTEYAWSTNETTSAINVNETGTYYVTATDVDGFSTTDSVYVQCPTISCDPAVNLGEDIAVEYGFCGVTLDAGNIYASYLWSTNETTPTIEITQPGEYHVTVTDQYNYISADTIMVLYPEIELSDTVLCAGTSALLNTGLGANYQYFWSTSSMNETITISQPSDVWVIVTDSLGCSKTSKTITVQFDSSANNIAFAVNDTTLCSGNTIAIDVPETWDYSYLWNTDSTGNNITVTETGRYYVTVTSQNQCSVIDSIDVNINGIAPIIEFTAEGHCLNDTLQITDNTYTPDSSEITLKTWSLTNHGNQVIDNPQFTLSTIGEAWLTLTAETEVGCSHTDSIQITIDTIPGFTITTPTTICQGKPSILTTSNVEGEIDQWFWYFNNTTLTGQEQTYTFSTLGEQSIRVSGIGLNGCSNIDTTYIEVVEPIIPEYTLELQNPPTEYNSVSSEITFEWSYQNDTTFTQYKLEIATDDQFETIIQERTTTASQITIEIEPTTISYWRVKGYTLCNDSVTSEIRTFQLFAPNQIEGLQLWLDAAHVTLEEEKITQWNDLSPNQHAIIQNNPNNRPVIAENTINGKPIVRFNGTSTYLDGGDILNLGTNSNSIFIVAKPNASSTGYIISKSIAISQESKWGIRTNQLFYQDNIIRSIDFSVPSDTFLLYSVTNDRVSADNILHINGSFKNSVSINATHSFQTPYNFIIGAYNNTTGGVPPYPNNAYFLDGDIAEIIMYNTLLSEEERKQVENYLMNKYSEPLELGNDIVVDYGFYPTELSIPNTYRNIIWSTGEISSTVFVNKTGKYYVQANDIFGRIQTDTINVYYPNPSIENKQICVGDSVLIAFGLGMQYKYKWSTGETSDSIFFNQSGQYSVQIIDTLEYSTTTTFEVMVDEFGNTISLGNDTALCSGNRVALQTGFEEAISYLWQPNDETSPTITITEGGTYSVIVENINGCNGYDTVVVAVSGIAPLLDYTAENLCFNQPSIFTAITPIPDSIKFYTWIFDETDTLRDPEISYTFPSAGSHTLSFSMESHGGCTSDTTTTISINQMPEAIFELNQSCAGFPIEITPEIENPNNIIITNYRWLINSVEISQSLTLSYIFPEEDFYTIEFQMETESGCVASKIRELYIPSTAIQPLNFDLLSPTDNLTTNPITTLFIWSAATGAQHYSLEIASSSNFVNPEISIDNLIDTSYSLVLPTQTSTLFWRVKAFNACMEYTTSESRTINIFNLNSTPGLALWLRADSVEITNGKVSQWYDLSPNSHTITQIISSAQPLKTLNSINKYPTISFNGSSTYLDGGDILDLGTNSNSIFIVAKPNASSTGYIISKSIAISQESKWGIRTNQLFYQDNIQRSIDFSVPTNTFSLFSVINNRASAKNILHINGVFENQATINATHSFQTPYNFIIGAYNNTSGGIPPYPNNSYYLNGDIAEIIMYNTLLSEEERKQVENYLMDKYAPPISIGNDIVVNYGFCPQPLTVQAGYSDILWSTDETEAQIEVSQTGSYWVQATDIFGRVTSDTINVTYPNIQLPADAAFCLGETYLASVVAGDGYGYQWSTGEIVSEIEITEPGNYWVQISDTLGCSKMHSFTVEVDMFAETMSLGDDRTLCNGNRIELVSGAEHAATYLWSDGTSVPYFTLNNQTEVSVTVTNTNGCSAIDTLQVTIGGTVPHIELEYSTPCNGQEIAFTDNSMPIGSALIDFQQWIFNDTDTLLGDIVHFTHPDTGIVNIAMKIGTNEGCFNDTSFQVNVHHTPSIQFIPTSGCERAPVLFQSLATANDGEMVAWQWDVDGTPYTSSGFVHTFAESGQYPVTLTATSEHGCTQSKTETFNAQNAPTANFRVENSCEGTPVLFINESESFLGSILDYLWTITPQSQSTAVNPEYNFQSTGNFDVTLKATQRINQCSDTITKTVTVSANPIARANDTAICALQSLELTETSIPGEGSVLISRSWKIDPHIGIISNNLLQTTDTAGTFPLQLIVKNSGGCHDTVTTNLTVHEKPKASIQIENDTVFVPTTIEATSEFTNDTYNYRWYLNDRFVAATPSIETPITAAGDVRYNLALETSYGCYDSTQRNITALIPAIDLEIVSLSALIDNGQILIRPVLRNNGTIPLSQFLLNVFTDNMSNFQEVFDKTLYPGMELGYTLRTQPTAPETNTPVYICVECQTIENDQNSENNRQCFLFEDNTRIFTPYPNPARDVINIEIISDIESMSNISMVNSGGLLLWENVIKVSTGLNQLSLPVPSGASGIIYVKVETNSKVKTFSIMINK